MTMMLGTRLRFLFSFDGAEVLKLYENSLPSAIECLLLLSMFKFTEIVSAVP